MPTAGLVRAAAAVASAALVVACTATSPEPAPTPSPSPSESAAAVARDTGERIAVIVPPSSVVAPAEAAALLRAAEELAATPPDGVASVRVVQAASEPFLRDLANLAVDDGLDLVCVVGTGSAELVLELARARRDGRFCTTDGRIAGGPVNVVAVSLDPAAVVEAGAVAIGSAVAPVGLVVSPQLGDTEALTAAFTSAVAPPRQPAPASSPNPTSSPGPTSSPTTAPEASGDTTSSAATTTTPSPSPASSPSPTPSGRGPTSPQPPFVTVTAGTGSAAQVSAGEQLAAQRPSRALVLATPGGAAAARTVAAAGAVVVVVSDWSVDEEGEAPPNLLVALTVDWGALLRSAVEAGRTPDAPQVQLVGIGDGVLDAIPGPVEEAVAAADRTSEHLRRSTE